LADSLRTRTVEPEAERAPDTPAPAASRTPAPRTPDGVPPTLARVAGISWRFLAVVAALAVVVYVLAFLRVIIIPVIVTLLVATLLSPPVDALRRRGWPNLAATWTVIGSAVLIFAALVVLLIPLVTGDLGEVRTQATAGVEELQDYLARPPFNITDARLSDYLEQAQERLRTNATGITTRVVSGAVLVGEVITGLILTLVLVFFFVKDAGLITGWMLDLSGRHREHVGAMGRRAATAASGYLRGVAIVGLVDGFFIGLGLLILRVPFALPLAFLTFVGAFLPLVGAFLAGALAALVALVAKGPVTALIVVAITVAVQQIEGHVLAPVVLGRAVKLHPVVILLALGAGAILGGIAGAFLAVPCAAVLTAVGGYLRNRETPEMAEEAAEPGEPPPPAPAG
jgi:putative heme transporter